MFLKYNKPIMDMESIVETNYLPTWKVDNRNGNSSTVNKNATHPTVTSNVLLRCVNTIFTMETNFFFSICPMNMITSRL